MQSFVSIIITCFNKEKFIDRAIRSCLNQITSGFSYEIIVVDDCSTDNSVDVIERFGQKISVVLLNENKGVAGASNAGLQAAKGDYWIRVDGDDFISQYALMHMLPILEQNSELDFVYADHVRVDLMSAVESYVRLDTEEKLLHHGAGVLFRRSAFEVFPPYDESFRNAEDYKLILELIRSKKLGYRLPLFLYRYFIHGDNLTQQPERERFIQLAIAAAEKKSECP